MYLLDADDAQVPAAQASASRRLGDSLVVVGGDGLWNVHVHVDDVGAAVEAGIAAGRPHRIRVTHFAEQVAEAGRPAYDGPHRPPGRRGRRRRRAWRSSSREAGAIVVVGGPGNRPSTGMILEAIHASGGAEVIVLPNDARLGARPREAAARTAEGDDGIRVAVIPTEAQVQGLAALAVHEPGRPFDQDVLEMTATARHARHGAVTVAVKQAMTMAGPCEPGDVLGVDRGRLRGGRRRPGRRSRATCSSGCSAGGGELVTIVAGDGRRRSWPGARADGVERAAPACRRDGVRRWPGRATRS